MNKDLLFNLYSIHSESGREKKMRKFLRKQCKECGATSIETDRHGNLLVIKGKADTYPCLAAHMDQVQRQHSKDFTVVEVGGDVLGWSPKCHCQQGLGADDKNGLFICLELLRRFDVMKVAFFVGEEVGCMGSSEVDLAFFKDCRFIIEPDRRGSSDLITSMSCGSVCSQAFVDAIGYADYGYAIERGTVTDVGELTERGVGVSCLNLSCGYYEAHSDEEITVLPELENCLNFVAHIVETCTDVYPFKGGRGAYGSFGCHSYYGGSHYGLGVSTRHMTRSDYDAACDAYYTDGSYDQDLNLMFDMLEAYPSISFDEARAFYITDFMACDYFDREECEAVLRDIYYEAIDRMRYFWWNDEDDKKKP